LRRVENPIRRFLIQHHVVDRCEVKALRAASTRDHQAGMPCRSASISAAPTAASTPATIQTAIDRFGRDVDGTIVSGQ
jgi:hypothetical protein